MTEEGGAGRGVITPQPRAQDLLPQQPVSHGLGPSQRASSQGLSHTCIQLL